VSGRVKWMFACSSVFIVIITPILLNYVYSVTHDEVSEEGLLVTEEKTYCIMIIHHQRMNV
jgi:hypothetical protein